MHVPIVPECLYVINQRDRARVAASRRNSRRSMVNVLAPRNAFVQVSDLNNGRMP